MDNKENLTIDLSSTQKKKIIINHGTETRELYINLSDMNLIVRFNEKLPELKKLEQEAYTKLSKTKINKSDEENAFASLAEVLKDIDTKMRDALDYIFDANASEACAPYGSMYDMLDGRLRYERILDALANLYNKSVSEEVSKIEKRINKHTNKYTGK